MADTVFQFSDLKFLITINSEGFDIDRDDYRIVLKRGSKDEVQIDKSAIVVDGSNHYLCVTKEQLASLGTGDIYMVVYAEVPDSDFEDSMRSEVYKLLLCHIERV